MSMAVVVATATVMAAITTIVAIATTSRRTTSRVSAAGTTVIVAASGSAPNLARLWQMYIGGVESDSIPPFLFLELKPSRGKWRAYFVISVKVLSGPIRAPRNTTAPLLTSSRRLFLSIAALFPAVA